MKVEKGDSPSVQYYLFDSTDVLYRFSYGLRDVKTKEEVNDRTTYHLYSITKTFTALAVLQLAEKNALLLDDPVTNYIKDFIYDKRITVRHLLTHTSGLPNPIPLRWTHLLEEHDRFNADRFFRNIFEQHSDLDFDPGTKFKYSNLGYVILGKIIENVSGMPYEDYIIEFILKPLGTTPDELGFAINRELHAVGYHRWFSLSNAVLSFLIDKDKYMSPRQGPWKPFKYFYNNGLAYGGMIGSPAGLMAYARALLKSDSLLINNSYKKMLFTENVVNNLPAGMSFSWFTGILNGNRYLAHAGGGGGYYVELRLYPDLGIGSMILMNRSGMKDERMLSITDRAFITTPSFAFRNR